MSTDTNRKDVIRLTDPNASNLALTGGKGANLAKLIDAGFPVPDGFCVTTAVYEDLVADEAVAPLIDNVVEATGTDGKASRNTASKLRNAIRSQELTDAVWDAVESELEPGTTYVVRSSATAEDLPSASFAGQHVTVLDVTGPENVCDAILECMASLFTDRAVSYRTSNDISHDQVSMAVVVQRMLEPDASGVMFTADPATGKRTIASIDAASGLGEAVVSGTVTADNVKVDRETGEILQYRTAGDGKREEVPEGECDWTARDDSEKPTDVARVNCTLTEAQVATLVSYGETIERLFDTPQDIEWAIADGQFWILQSRPITTLFPIPEPSPSDDGVHVYYSWNHRQGMTKAMPPLVLDYWLRTMDVIFDGLGYEPEAGPVAVTAGGRMYLDLTSLVRSKRLAPRIIDGLEEFDRQATKQLETVHDRQRDELAEVTLLGGTSLTKTLSTGVGLLPLVGRSLGGIVHGLIRRDYERAPQQGRQWADRTAQRLRRDIRSETSLKERIQRTLDATAEFTWIAVERALLLWNVYCYRRVLERLCPGANVELEALERGLRENVTTAMMLELGDITDLARDYPAVEAAILKGKSLEEIKTVEDGESFVDEFESFLERYGFRAAAEIEFSQPRYREDPSALLDTVRSSLETGTRGEHRERIDRLEAEADQAIERLERRAQRARFGSLRRQLIRPLAMRYRSYLSLREVTKYGLSQLLDETRQQVLDAGALLESQGGLEKAEDVWLYDFEELLAALDEPSAPPKVDMDARRAEFRANDSLRPPRVITSTGEVPRADKAEGSDVDGLIGTPTASGVTEGIVQVIHDPGDATIDSGNILVAPHTDPGWTPLFLNAAGLVTDVGGEMTHGSLVAREYGIPSVVLAEATEKLETGDRVRVDGNRGIVERLDED